MLSGLESLPNLSSSEVLYERAFKLFLDSVDNSLNHKLWLLENVSELLPSHTDCISVLSVGCGDGNTDIDVVLRPLLEKYEEVTYHGIEPNGIHRARFFERLKMGMKETEYTIEELGDTVTQLESPHIKVSLFNTKFENFTTTSRYNLILCGHSLYYIKPLGSSLHRLLFDLLHPNGHLMVIHSTPGGIPQFQRSSGVISGLHNITTFTILDELRTQLDIQESFRTEWIPHLTARTHSQVSVHISDTYLNVDCIFEEAHDEQARLLLGFFIDKDLSDASKEQVDDLRQLMRTMSMKTKAGEWLFWHPEGRIIVKAPNTHANSYSYGYS